MNAEQWKIVRGMINIAKGLPIIGQPISKAFRLTQLWSTPCSISPMVGIEAFAMSIPKLLWMRPHTTEERALKRSFTSEFGGQGGTAKHPYGGFHGGLSAKIEQASEGIGGVIGQVAQWTWTGIELTEKVGWWIMFADAIEDVGINGTTLAYIWSGCPFPGAASAHMDAIVGAVVGTGPPSWPFIFFHNIQFRGMSAGPGAITIPKGMSGYVCGSVMTAPIPENPNYEISFTIEADIGVIDIHTMQSVFDPETGSTSHYTNPIYFTDQPTDTIYTMVAHGSYGSFTITGGFLTGYAGKTNEGISPLTGENWY